MSPSSLVRHLAECNTERFVKKLLGENEIEATLRRLNRLTLEEVRATAAQTLEVVYGLVRHKRALMDGEKPNCFVLRLLLNFHTLDAEGNELVASVSDALGMFHVGWQYMANTMFASVIESIQEILSKTNEEKRGLSSIGYVHIDDREH